MGGRWIASQKAWQVDPAKVENLLNTGAGLYRDETPTPTKTAQKGTMSYAEFVRSSDDPNSDY